MPTIHCHRCGGFIDNPDGTTYREPSATTPPAVPHSKLCACDHSLVYGSAPEPVAHALRVSHRIRSASHN